MRAHDAEHGREAQATPRILGAVKRFEDFCLRGVVHAAAGVGHLDVEVTAGDQVVGGEKRSRVALLDLARSGRDADASRLIADCLRGVDDEVHDDLLELRDIGENRGQAEGQVE